MELHRLFIYGSLLAGIITVPVGGLIVCGLLFWVIGRDRRAQERKEGRPLTPWITAGLP